MTLVIPSDRHSAAELVMEPRLFTYVNGTYIPASRIQVIQSAFGVADTLEIDTYVDSAPMDYSQVSQQIRPLPMQVKGGYSIAGQRPRLAPMLAGIVDAIETIYDTDELILRGRGVLAPLIDTRLDVEVEANVTVTQAITTLIKKYSSLTPQVAQTSIKVGRVLKDDYVATGRSERVLDFIHLLCRDIGWKARVQGSKLIVGPPPADSSAPILRKNWATGQGAGTKLRVTHNAFHSKDIKVRVISYVPHTKTHSGSVNNVQTAAARELGLPAPVAAKGPKRRAIGAPRTGRHAGFTTTGESDTSEEYVVIIPGLTPEECFTRAQAIRDDLVMKEFVAELTFVPTTDELYALMSYGMEYVVDLRGCSQRSHNRRYYPKQVTWDWAVAQGSSGDAEGLTCTVLMVSLPLPAPTGGE